LLRKEFKPKQKWILNFKNSSSLLTSSLNLPPKRQALSSTLLVPPLKAQTSFDTLLLSPDSNCKPDTF
jgi:hypothetical protein